MTQICLEATELSITIHDRLLFTIPHLALYSHQAVYLSGQNGVGKTTLLKILAGLQSPNKGQLSLKKPSLFQRFVGFSGYNDTVYMHQSPYLFDTSVEKNVLYGLHRQKQSRKEREQRLHHALKKIQLHHLRHQHISLLSGGEKQKVAMARAWVTRPSILLMDESSSNLDTETSEIQAMMVKDLLNQGTSVVITSHLPNALTSCCTQHWIIENQRLTTMPKHNTKDFHVVTY